MKKRNMANYLEIDSKILENNLLLQKNSAEADNLENLFRSPEKYVKENTPWRLVTPKAGFCLKTTDLNDRKVFINVCKLDDIPEPKDITEAELLKMWQSDDIPDYRIPLSIQEPHDELDKSGNPMVAYDVALNTNFFEKIQSSMIFRSFVLQVVLEGVENKYDIELKKEGYIILRNRRCFGELKPHRIRISKIPDTPSRPLIEELQSTTNSGDLRMTKKDEKVAPEFRLFENTRSKFLIAEFYLPKVATLQGLSLGINESRLILESRRGPYFIDMFVPFIIDEAETEGRFNLSTKVLTIKMPIIGASA